MEHLWARQTFNSHNWSLSLLAGLVFFGRVPEPSTEEWCLMTYLAIIQATHFCHFNPPVDGLAVQKATASIPKKLSLYIFGRTEIGLSCRQAKLIPVCWKAKYWWKSQEFLKHSLLSTLGYRFTRPWRTRWVLTPLFKAKCQSSSEDKKKNISEMHLFRWERKMKTQRRGQE